MIFTGNKRHRGTHSIPAGLAYQSDRRGFPSQAEETGEVEGKSKPFQNCKKFSPDVRRCK